MIKKKICYIHNYGVNLMQLINLNLIKKSNHRNNKNLF